MVEYLAGWKSILQVKRAMWEKCKAREKELGPEGIKALFEGGVRGAGIREVEIHPRVYIVQRLPTPTQVAVLGPARVTRREINYNEEDEEDVPFDDEEYEPPIHLLGQCPILVVFWMKSGMWNIAGRHSSPTYIVGSRVRPKVSGPAI